MVVYESIKSGICVGISKPLETLAFMTGLLTPPCFVVTKITPFAPLAPNTAVAEASFKIDIVLISEGSMVVKSLSTLSTITSGAEPFQLETPRINMSAAFLPGSPDCCIVSTPESFPAIAFVTVDVPALINDSLFTVEIAPTTLSFF